MSSVVLALANKVQCMEEGFIYSFVGRGFVYTYQTSGVGTVSVYVSNDRKTWTYLAEFTDDDSASLMHSWQYQKVEGTDLVLTVNRG